jgi:hypothetical protein
MRQLKFQKVLALKLPMVLALKLSMVLLLANKQSKRWCMYAGIVDACVLALLMHVCWHCWCMYAACWHAFRIFFDACMPHARIAKHHLKCLLKAYFFGCLYAALVVRVCWHSVCMNAAYWHACWSCLFKAYLQTKTTQHDNKHTLQQQKQQQK